MSNPFAAPPSVPGKGTIHLALLPPSTPRLRTFNYQYPLKLVAPAALTADVDNSHLIHTVYLLTYGGGLVAGDQINLNVILEETTRLILLTQGSTKLFKAPSRNIVSRQSTTVDLRPDSALCYLPDPVQPFGNSNFEQRQIYNVQFPSSPDSRRANLCVLDWVSNGRPANGENWSFFHYESRNEVYLCHADGRRKLLLRDNVLLNDANASCDIAYRMDGLAVYGTFILNGPMFDALGHFFMDEFKQLPRIGGRKWDSGSEHGEDEVDSCAQWREERHRFERERQLRWSAASVRGIVVVKFGAPLLESGRKWLFMMLSHENTLVERFGERALLCLR